MDYLKPVDKTHSDYAGLYDELALWSAPFGLMLLERVHVRAGMTILDIGAGTGFTTVELAQRCGPTATVIAVDPWEAGMRRLRRKVERLGLANVQLMEQDAATIALPDASIDLIVSNLGINNFVNATAVLQTCYRVSKPDGRLFLTTNLVGHMQEFYEVYRATLLELDLVDELGALDTHINHRATLKSMTEMLTQAGFELLGIATDSFRMRFADGSSFLRHYFIRLGFLPDWKSIVPVDAIESTFAVLERKLNDLASQRHQLVLTIPMACVEVRKVGANGESKQN